MSIAEMSSTQEVRRRLSRCIQKRMQLVNDPLNLREIGRFLKCE